MSGTPSSPRPLLTAVYAVYFVSGLALCFEGAFNPEFKDVFQLGYQQQMYTLFAKNLPFALALAIGFLLPRIGYPNCLALGLVLFAAGTLLLVPGLRQGSYPVVLTAFFIIGLGFNCQLVAGNPLLGALGPADTAASRLNLGNALGAIAQILGPITLTLIIPANITTAKERLPYMTTLFAVVGVVLLGFALLTFLVRKPGLGTADLPTAESTREAASTRPRWLTARLGFAFATIFLALGVEAGLFGLYRNYLEDPSIGGLTPHQSQRLFTLYFALFALGRVVGAAVQRTIRPAVTLLVGAGAALALLGLIVTARGPLAIAAMTAIGFCVAIFFPTLYALAIAGLGAQTARASGLLTTGFLGCAVLPVLQGRIADRLGLQFSYAIAGLAYLAVAAYAVNEIRRSHPIARDTA